MDNIFKDLDGFWYRLYDDILVFSKKIEDISKFFVKFFQKYGIIISQKKIEV